MMYSAGLPAYDPTGQHRLPDYPQTLQPAAQANWIWPSPTITGSPYPRATVGHQIANVIASGTVPMFSPPLGTSVPSLSPSTITNPISMPQLKDIHQSVEGEKKKSQKKVRATFSSTQTDELEKAFHASQYLSTHDRHILAERLGLTENQIKIWFQDQRTKCRRTAWKSRSPSCSKVPTSHMDI